MSRWPSTGPSSANSSVARNRPPPSKNAGDLSRFLSSFTSLASALGGADARIEQADQHVGAEVGDQHGHGHQQAAAGDDRVVVALNRRQDGGAEAGITE